MPNTGQVPDVSVIPDPPKVSQTKVGEFLLWIDRELMDALEQVRNDAFNDEDFGALEGSHAEVMTLKRVRDTANRILNPPSSIQN